MFVTCERCGITYIYSNKFPHNCLLDEAKALSQKIWELKQKEKQLKDTKEDSH